MCGISLGKSTVLILILLAGNNAHFVPEIRGSEIQPLLLLQKVFHSWMKKKNQIHVLQWGVKRLNVN